MEILNVPPFERADPSHQTEPDSMINDQFTDLPISRQRRYQLRKKAKGLCVICGKRKAITESLCARCSKKRGVKHPGKQSKR